MESGDLFEDLGHPRPAGRLAGFSLDRNISEAARTFGVKEKTVDKRRRLRAHCIAMAVLASTDSGVNKRIIGRPHYVSVRAIKAAYAAFGRNDPSVLFAAMDSAIHWNEAEGNPLADRNPYVGPQAVGEGVFARLVAAIDNFTAVPSTFIDGGDHVVILGRYGGAMKDGGATLDSPFCHVYRFHGDKAVTFQQYTDTAQWKRLMTSRRFNRNLGQFLVGCQLVKHA